MLQPLDTVSPPLGLLGISTVTGKAPDSRLKTSKDARRELWACIQEDTAGGRSRERAITKGLIDGNPPYNDSRKRAEGRGWECNLNFMEGQAIMDSSGVPYYALFANVPYYFDCKTRFQPGNPDHETWNSKITYCFDNMLKRWRQFNWNIQQVSYWMRLHGIGHAYFDREGDWRFRGLETGNVLVPKGSPSCVDDRLPFIFIRMQYRIVELWDWIKDPESATAAGCNVQAIKNAIMYGMKGLAPGGSEWWAQPWEYYERLLNNNDMTVSYTDCDVVYCCHVLVQEFGKPGQPKKISKYLFTEHEVVSRSTNLKDDDQGGEFLFADPNSYDSFTQCIVSFFQNTGDGTWHSVRGLAMKAFKHLEVSNRLKCQTVNRAFLDSSLIFQRGSGRNTERVQLAVWGSVVNLPANGELKQIVTQGGTQGVMEVDRMLTNHLANNIGMFNQRTLSREDGKGEQPTATQINQQVAKESTLSEGQITLWYQYEDTLGEEMFRRSADPSTSDAEAKRFQKELLDEGVPREALADMEYVRANRQSGYGSPQMALLKQQQMLPLVPMLPEQGKENWLRLAVTTIEGPEKVDLIAPKQYIPNEDDSIAALENGLMTQGIPPVISSGQDDVVHLNTHFQFLQQTLGPISQAMDQGQQVPPDDLQTTYKTSQTAIPHMEAHIARIQNDPMRRGQAKLFQDQLRQVTAFDGKLRAELYQAIRDQQVQAEQQQQASSLSALDQAKVASIQTQTQLAAQKTQSQIQNQTAKTIHGIRLKSLKQGADLNLDVARTAADIHLNTASTAADIQNQKAKVQIPKELGAEAA